MSFQITLQPSGHEYQAEEGSTILQSALDAGIKLPYGCQNGACGACKGKVVSGQFDHGAAPEGTLPADQRAEGMASDDPEVRKKASGTLGNGRLSKRSGPKP